MNSKNLILVLFLAFAAPVFAQNADMSLIPYRKGDLWGYAAPDKSIVIKPEYEEAHRFYEGFAAVKKGGKFGYINKEGKVVIPFKFFSAKAFQFGFYGSDTKPNPKDKAPATQKTVLFAGASLQANGYEICIDTKGNQLAKCPAINEVVVADNDKPATVTVVSNYSTIQKSELFDKITGDYKIIANAEETYYIAVRNNNYGVFNNKFDVIVPFEYSSIEKINIGPMVYLKVDKNGQKGILFGTGSPYLAIENSRLDILKAANGNSYFIFTKDGQTGIKDTHYSNVVEPVYSDIAYDSTGGGFVLTASGIYKGYVFPNNRVLLPRFTEVRTIKNTDFIMVKNAAGKWGYINNDLTEYFED
ncbi:MAG: WG repeat-containing protein [Ferruginibacter sp.]